jgi:hypothetical protein
MKRCQVVEISLPPANRLRNPSCRFDIETELHQTMKQHLIGEPAVPFLTGALTHFDGVRLSVFEKLRDSRKVSFSDLDRELLPTRSLRPNPGVG